MTSSVEILVFKRKKNEQYLVFEFILQFVLKKQAKFENVLVLKGLMRIDSYLIPNV